MVCMHIIIMQHHFKLHLSQNIVLYTYAHFETVYIFAPSDRVV